MSKVLKNSFCILRDGGLGAGLGEFRCRRATGLSRAGPALQPSRHNIEKVTLLLGAARTTDGPVSQYR